MKKQLSIIAVFVCAALLLSGFSVCGESKAVLTDRTKSVFQTIKTGGLNGDMVVTGMNQSEFCMGFVTEAGEITWMPYSAAFYPELFADEEWVVSESVCMESSCPYYHEHNENTVCPWMQVWKETILNTETQEEYGPYYTIKPIHVTGLSIEMCRIYFDRTFVSPENLRWEPKSGRYFAVKGDNDKWGIYDAYTDTQTVAYLYDDIDAPEKNGVFKAQSNGFWGAVDAATGEVKQDFTYAADDKFSIIEELRLVDIYFNYAVFNADNEQISSCTFALGSKDYEYYPDAHVIKIGLKYYDLNGDLIFTPTNEQRISYLQGDCFALMTYAQAESSWQFKSMSLAYFNGLTMPNDTVLMGDVNLDGTVNTSDARLELSAAVGTAKLTDRMNYAGDIYKTGAPSSRNARKILIMGIEAA